MQAFLIVLGILIILIGALFFIAKAKIKILPVVTDNVKILTLTDTNFQQQTKNKVVLVDFWASWCAPCRMMAPILNDVASELSGDMYVGKVNVDQCQGLANKYRVRSIPTLILFKNGKEINRFVGVKQKDFLLKEIRKA